MSRENLALVVEIVKSTSNHTTTQVRGNIYKLWETFFENIDTVAHSLKELEEKSECYTILQWFYYLTERRVEIFLTPHPHGDETGSSQIRIDSEEEKISFEFSKWFMCTLLRFLSAVTCQSVHQKCIDIIKQLFLILKWKNSYYYCTMLTEIVHTIADLVKANDKLYETNDHYCVDLNRFNIDLLSVNSSLVAPEKREEAVPQTIKSQLILTIDSIEMCECLQINMVKILQHATDDIPQQLAKSTCNVVWGAMCCHVELGQLLMKQESLRVLDCLINYSGLPTLDVLKYFLSCIMALIELLCSGCDGGKKCDIISLEEVTASVIENIIKADRKTLNSNHLSLSQIQHTLQQLTVTIVTYQMKNLSTQSMKCAIVKLIDHCLDRLSSSALLGPVLKPVKESLTSTLIKTLGSAENTQYLVSTLVKLCLSEINMGKVGKDNNPELETSVAATQGSSKSALSQYKRKRKLDSDDKPKRTKVPKTLKLLSTKLQSLIGQLHNDMTEEEAVPYLEGIQVGLEAILSCYYICVCQDKTKKEIGYQVTGDMQVLDWWINPAMIQQLMERCIQSIIVRCNQWKQSSVSACLLNVLSVCTNYLRLKDTCYLDGEILQNFLWILSLPWLPNDPSWMDLKPDHAKEIANVAKNLVDNIDLSVKCSLLEGLAFFPKDTSPKWRVHIFRQAFCDTDWQIRNTAVKSFPLLLQNLGPNANHLVHDLVSPVVNDKHIEVQASLAKVVGILACVVCRKAVVRRNSEDLYCPFHGSFHIQCLSCDNLRDEESCNASKSRPNLVDPNMFVPYLSLLSSGDTTVKKNIIESLKRMFGHIGVRAKSSTIVNMVDTALKVIKDPDYNIRVSFSKVVPYLVGENCNETNQRIVTKLKEVRHEAHSDQNIKLQETIILTLAQFGRVAENEQLLVVILNLLDSMISPLPLIAAVAYEQLKYVAQYKKTKTQNLFMKSRLPICKFLAEAMHNKVISGADTNNAVDILRDVSNVLDFPDVKNFLMSANKFMVPHLVSIATSEASSLLKRMATIIDLPNRKKIMIDNTKFIFSYIVRYFQPADQEKAMKFLQKETEFDMEELLRYHFQPTHNELLLHLSTHYTEVFSGLTVLSGYDQDYKGPKIRTSEHMADYLQPRLLGVIGFFDSQLLNNNIPLEDKKLTLESLTAMIRLMGRKHIGMIRYKIVNTLRIGLQITDRSFQEISCKAWNCFVRSLDTPFLGHMMSQIIATLLPLLNSLPKQVAELFNFMIVEQRESLSGHFHEVYFLPDIPELAAANNILKQYTEGPSSQSDLRTRLLHSMKGISHESLDVRLHALSKLKKLLRDEKEDLYQFVIGNETADPIVSQVVSVLLSGCRDSDSRAQILYAECIGELGAIDPGRLELTTNDPKADIAKFNPNISDEKFAVELINQVVKGFLAATETRIQDGAALALQELLRIYNIKETSQLWNKFADHVKEILIPLFSSKYTLTSQQDWTKVTKPIFLSEKSRTFAEWVSTWTGYLLSKVKQDHAKSVFLACTAAIKNDVHIALYILPYVVTQVLQDGSTQDLKEVFHEILEVISHTQKPDTKHREGNFHHLSAQTVFSVLDHLTKWKRIRAQISGGIPGKGPAYMSDPGYKAVDNFLQKIPQDLLAHACFSCGAYTRALMHFEQFICSKNQNVQDHLDFLQRLYVAMDESDGVIGVAAIRQTQPTLMEQILIHESLGQHQDAQACYEKAIDSEVDSVDNHKGLLQSLMELGQQNKALLHATGAIAERPEWVPQLRSYMVEAAWKLGNWDKLEKCIKSEKGNRSWAVGVGEILLSAKAKDEEKFMKHLQIVRREQIGPLSAASMESGSYQRGYQHIVWLHLLNEIEECFRVLTDLRTESGDTADHVRISPTDLLKNWDTRLQVMQWSFRAQEPLLTLRRTLFTLAQQMTGHDFDHEIGHWWLWSAKIARKEGYAQTAYSSLLQARDYNLPEVFVEKAKWFWHKGDKDPALSCLERGMSVHFPDVNMLKSDASDQAKARLKIYAQALLLYGRYSDEASTLESNAILKKYREVIDIYGEWEEGHFYLAQYYDKIMTTLFEENSSKGSTYDRIITLLSPLICNEEEDSDFIQFVVKHLGHSLLYGSQYIYQSMPRMLSLWLDYGTMLADIEKQDRQKPQINITQKLPAMRLILARLNKLIKDFGIRLAPYQLFTAYPQLISRICHAHCDVFEQLKDIIARIFVQFPKQSLWMMMAVSKSSYSMRVQRCQEIFTQARSKRADLNKFIQDGTKLTERLLELCNKDFKNAPTISVTQHFRPLKRLLEDSNFSNILVPLQSAMTVTLPNTPGSHQDHNPFPCNEVYIRGFEDTIEVLPSLQRPKKITLMGSDGKLYIMMCKPKDDLRKDCRLMEFNGIINKFLHKDPDSRRRQLHIRTYSVIPLNEECGLIEWINNTSGLRHILMKYYRERGLAMTGKELKDACPNVKSSVETKLQVLKEKLLPRHPALFKEWFLRTFQDPTSWYNARVSYARTAAVMSMVGYILGLGDRHGENILFDSANGDCVHVDFNCLFNKGETFEWPERVPFRLTHNMIDAMGPMGYEGIFRKACEVTLRVMRTQMDPLMSVLKPFIYDPLVEWSKPIKPQGQRFVPGQRSMVGDTGEINNELAMTHVQNIEDRLKGLLKSTSKQGQAKPRSVALSIEGHVKYLINEATNERNLGQMYIGWAAYL